MDLSNQPPLFPLFSLHVIAYSFSISFRSPSPSRTSLSLSLLFSLVFTSLVSFYVPQNDRLSCIHSFEGRDAASPHPLSPSSSPSPSQTNALSAAAAVHSLYSDWLHRHSDCCQDASAFYIWRSRHVTLVSPLHPSNVQFDSSSVPSCSV